MTRASREQRAARWRTWALVCAVAFGVAVLARWPAGEWVAVSVGLVAGILFWRAQATLARERERARQVLDAMQTGIVLYDADDRLVLANADFRRLYESPGLEIRAGQTFETLLRDRVLAGNVPEARGREQAWIAERLVQRQAQDNMSFLREMPDSRWRRITEQRLPDGSRLAFSIDVTELVENQRALDAARHEAERAHQLLRDAVEAMPAAVEVYDRSDRLVLFNHRMLELYPHMAGQTVLGETFEALARSALARGMVPEAAGREEAWLADRLSQRGCRDHPVLLRAPTGAWVHIYETPMAGGGLVTVRLDATEVVQQREALVAARDQIAADHALLDDAIEALPDGFALYDADDRLVLCNRRYREIYHTSAPALVIGASFESILRYGLERGQYPQATTDPEAWLAERLRRHREPDGVPILQELEGNHWLRIDERRSRSGGVAGVRTDVTEMVRTRQQLEMMNATVDASRREAEAAAASLREANAMLEQLSTTDALTGIANRRRFDVRLAEEVLRARRHGTPLALLLIDIDHFKLYNDHHGHPQGDRALQAVAAVLGHQARRPGELVARYGGEEFALLLPHADAATAMTVAERCGSAMATLALPHGFSPTAAHVSLSIGAALLHGAEHEDAATLLRRADAALYAAKAAGRARCVMADEPGRDAIAAVQRGFTEEPPP